VATEPVAQAAAVTDVRREQARMALARARAVSAARDAARHAAAQRALHAVRARALVGTATRARAASARTPSAGVVPTPKQVEPYLARGTRAYAALHYDVTLLGYTVVFQPGVGGLLGLTDAGSRTITVYVRTRMSDVVLSHTIAHEIGHALDFTRGTALTHARYLATRRLGGTLAWFGCGSCTDYATPAGDWAEVFATWLAGPGDFRSQLAGPPSAAELRALTPLFAL
jgi:hypothetical protein